MKILTFSTLYPSAANPTHGVFVENRLADFGLRHDVETKVIAPVAWFPFRHPFFGDYAKHAAAPLQETRRGFDVRHPRYFLPPRIGMAYAAGSLTRCLADAARRLIASGWDFDLIDAHYLYPDGVAAIRVGAMMEKPVVLTARGSDVSLLPSFPRQRAMILDAVRRAESVICVAGALKDELVRLGAPPEKLIVLRNGVDLDLFRQVDRISARMKYGVQGRVVASVGHLIDRKGHDIAIKAISKLPDATLLIAGDGPEFGALRRLAASEGVADRVRFLGRIPHADLPVVYSAADALILASSREGWPNVLLEAMACGTPAVAAPIWGCGEVISTPDAGRLASDRTPAAFAAALTETLAPDWNRDATRAHAERHAWIETSAGLKRVFDAAVARGDKAASVKTRPLHTAAGPPRLLLTVDTEEEFDWSGYSADQHTLNNVDDIARFQSLCEGAGAKPLYFITYPLLRDSATSTFFRGLKERGAADLGLHLHQWNTPPAEGFAGEYYSWQCNLPLELYEAKLRELCSAFEAAFGFAPTSHRAGRYGVRRDSYAALAACGVAYDFSPSPAFDFSPAGGPDFGGMSTLPFAIRAGDSAEIFVTPVSGAAAFRGTSHFLSQAGDPGFTFSAPGRYRKKITAPLRLTCEQSRLDELKSLTRRLVADGSPALTYSLHSTSLSPSANPYAPDAMAVDETLELIANYLKFFREEIGGEFIDLADLAALYRGPDKPAPRGA